LLFLAAFTGSNPADDAYSKALDCYPEKDYVETEK
jgi:hypothetical protein